MLATACADCGGSRTLRARVPGATQPASVHGSPEVLIDDGVRTAVSVTFSWTNRLVRAVHGLADAGAISRAITATFQRVDHEELADELERTSLHAQMLGALDSQWESENEALVAPVAFDAKPGFAGQPYASAISFFESKRIVSPSVFAAMSDEAKKQAFTVARATSDRMLRTAHSELLRQIRGGADLRDFRKRVATRMESAGWTPANPSHVECLVGATPVTGAVVRAAHRRWHEGPIVEVITAAGRKFTTTPNHPMLTRRGWVVTGELREGDDLVGYRGQQRPVPVGDQDVAAPPATIAEIFSACSEVAGLERVRSTVDDFHGDGSNGDVDIARPARELRFGSFAPITQPLEDQVFTTSKFAGPRFCDRCHHLVVVTQRCGFCDAPQPNTSIAEYTTDGVVAGVELASQAIGAFASEVTIDDSGNGQIVALARRSRSSETKHLGVAHRAPDTGGAHHCHNPLGVLANKSSDAPDAQPGDVEFDRVVSCRIVQFAGHVYNLSTPHGYFNIAGLYTGNTIFRTNVTGAYNAGRYREMTQPDVLAARPYWQIVTVNDGPPRQRPTHQAVHLWVLRADDAFFKRAFPPFGFSCRCRARSLSHRQVLKLGLTVRRGSEIRNLPDPGFAGGPPPPLPGTSAPPRGQPARPAPVAPTRPDVPTPRRGPRRSENERPPELPPLAFRKGQPVAADLGLGVPGPVYETELQRRALGQHLRDLDLVSDRPSPAAQRGVRGRLRELLAEDGFDSRAVRDDQPFAKAVRVKHVLGARGTMSLVNGEMKIASDVARDARDAVRTLARGEQLSRRELDGLRTYVHEELHACSRIGPGVYHGSSAALEEALTEMAARRQVARIQGIPRPVQNDLTLGPLGGGSYHQERRALHDLVREAYRRSGTFRPELPDGALDVLVGDRIHQATRVMRGAKAKEIRTAADHFDRFAASLPELDNESRGWLRGMLPLLSEL